MPSHKRLRLHLHPLPLILLPIFLIGVLSPYITLPLPPSPSPSSSTFLPFSLSTSSCLPNLLIDIPSNSSPTSVLSAFTSQIPSSSIYTCRAPSCADYLASICAGETPPARLIAGYFNAPATVINCLRAKMGYYSMYAARKPLERWTVEYTSSSSAALDPAVEYLDYMAGYESCTLLHYFDGLGKVCADEDDVVGRVEGILERFDEAFDVWEGWGGEVWKSFVESRVVDAVKRERPSKKFRAFLGVVRLAGETRLYQRGRESVKSDRKWCGGVAR